MKIRSKYLFVPSVMALLALASCTNEDVVQENKKQNEQKGVTEFAMTVDKDAMKTRTKGLYTGSAIDFYWTNGDMLWVNAPGSGLEHSISSDIPTTGEATSAKFMFGEAYGAESYPVRYTGNGNEKGDEVTIKASQNQADPKDGSHIGVDGDCGLDMAKRQKTSTRFYYSFTLKHKAAYLTFMPYYTKTQLANSVIVKQIKLTADEDIAGTYAFDDNGLAAKPKSNGSKSITLDLTGTFNIPQQQPDYNKNAAIMVVAPGTYHNVKVEYTLYDSKTGVTGTVVTRNYPNITFKVGENHPFKKHDLGMNLYAAKYTTWDAEKYYWNDESDVPLINGESKKVTDPKTNYKNTTAQGASASDQVYRNCKYPNANQMAYYVWHGKPHWDGTTLWVRTGHLYQGGLWLLKCADKTKHPDFSDEYYMEAGGNKADYRANSTWTNWNAINNGTAWKVSLTGSAKEKPSDTSAYFFLPAMGYAVHGDGVLQTKYAGYYGVYWSATSYYGGGVSKAISFHFSDTEVGMSVDNRDNVYPIFEVQ